jgi:hypothetical protein
LKSGSRGVIIRKLPLQALKMGTNRLLLTKMKRIRMRKEMTRIPRRMEKMTIMMKMTTITTTMMTTMMTFTMTTITMVASCCPFLKFHSDEFSWNISSYNKWYID